MTTKKIVKNQRLLLIPLFLVTAFFRFTKLGYSELQGDEVTTVDFTRTEETFTEYLFRQLKGPTQFSLNWVNVKLFGAQSEFSLRFPYAVAGTLFVLVLFIFVRELLGFWPAYWAAWLAALNGFFIGFSRVIQYQSLLHLFGIISLWLFWRALKDKRPRRKLRLVVYSAIWFWLALLSHYDALTFLAFILPLAIFEYLAAKDGQSRRWLVKQAGVFFVLVTTLSLAYYLPFFLHPHFGDKTSGYLEKRVFGGGLMPRTDVSWQLSSMYSPPLYIIFLIALAFLAVYIARPREFKVSLAGVKLPEKLLKAGIALGTLLAPAALIFSFYPIKPRTATVLFGLSTVGVAVSCLLAAGRKINKEELVLRAVSLWFLATTFVYVVLMRDPRSHIYTAYIPAFILAGYAAARVVERVRVKLTGVLVIILILTAVFEYRAFLEAAPEHPFAEKMFLGRVMFAIDENRKIQGVFGFPHFRGWEEINTLYESGCLVGDYRSNEKNSITSYYLGEDQTEELYPVNYVLVAAPVSWSFVNIAEPPAGEVKYDLRYRIFVNGQPLTYVYSQKDVTIPPAGCPEGDIRLIR